MTSAAQQPTNGTKVGSVSPVNLTSVGNGTVSSDEGNSIPKNNVEAAIDKLTALATETQIKNKHPSPDHLMPSGTITDESSATSSMPSSGMIHPIAPQYLPHPGGHQSHRQPYVYLHHHHHHHTIYPQPTAVQHQIATLQGHPPHMRQQDSKIDRVRREYHNDALAVDYKSATESVSELHTLRMKMHGRCQEKLNMHPKLAKFFVIKSFGEDDVHKSIKYNVWCSTEKGNNKLNEAWQDRMNDLEQNPSVADHEFPIYLFYSVNRSGRFCGVARLESGYDKSSNETIWMEDGKWNGKFSVSWLLVKDVPNSHLKHICLPNNDNKPVTYSRDTQEIPYDQGLTVLQTFVNFQNRQSLLDNYLYYDKREDQMQQSKQYGGSDSSSGGGGGMRGRGFSGRRRNERYHDREYNDYETRGGRESRYHRQKRFY